MSWTVEKRINFIHSALRSIGTRVEDANNSLEVLADIISDIEVDIEYCHKHLEAAMNQREQVTP